MLYSIKIQYKNVWKCKFDFYFNSSNFYVLEKQLFVFVLFWVIDGYLTLFCDFNGV